MRRRAALIATAAVVAVCLAPSAAQGSTASVDTFSRLLEYAAATGEVNNVTFSRTAGGFVISDRGAVQFSRDGSRVFFGTSPPVPPDKEEGTSSDETVVADLWHYKDPFIQPMQKVRAAQERTRSYRAVYHIAEKKFVQLASNEMAGLSPSDDGRFAIGARGGPGRAGSRSRSTRTG